MAGAMAERSPRTGVACSRARCERDVKMKRTLSVIAGLGILAVTLGLGTAHARSYRRYVLRGSMRRQRIARKPAVRFAARAVHAPFHFPTRTVRKPPAAAALVTIEPSRIGEKRPTRSSRFFAKDVRRQPQCPTRIDNPHQAPRRASCHSGCASARIPRGLTKDLQALTPTACR